MAYGMSISTTDGVKNILDIRTTRLIANVLIVAPNRTVSVPDYDSNKGHLYFHGFSCFSGGTWNNSTKVYTMDAAFATELGGNAFVRIMFLHYK